MFMTNCDYIYIYIHVHLPYKGEGVNLSQKLSIDNTLIVSVETSEDNCRGIHFSLKKKKKSNLDFVSKKTIEIQY